MPFKYENTELVDESGKRKSIFEQLLKNLKLTDKKLSENAVFNEKIDEEIHDEIIVNTWNTNAPDALGEPLEANNASFLEEHILKRLVGYKVWRDKTSYNRK